MDHLGLPEQLQKNIRLQYYDAGHMMYLRDEDLAKLKIQHRRLIDSRLKTLNTATISNVPGAAKPLR